MDWFRGDDTYDAEASAHVLAETLIRLRAVIESMQKKD